jgi:hypothetical protein
MSSCLTDAPFGALARVPALTWKQLSVAGDYLNRMFSIVTTFTSKPAHPPPSTKSRQLRDQNARGQRRIDNTTMRMILELLCPTSISFIPRTHATILTFVSPSSLSTVLVPPHNAAMRTHRRRYCACVSHFRIASFPWYNRFHLTRIHSFTSFRKYTARFAHPRHSKSRAKQTLFYNSN